MNNKEEGKAKMYCSKTKKSFECPFTWNISRDLSISYDEDKELQTAEGDQQVISLLNSVMAIYCAVVNQNYGVAKRKMVEIDGMWKRIDVLQFKVERISLRALKHVIDSTKYHTYHLVGDTASASKILRQITDSSSLSEPIELATIHGCRAIAYSSFHEKARFEALDDAKLAVAHFNNCPLWQFVLYKSLRYKRRKAAKFGTKPDEDERTAILECTRLSEKPFYLVHAAQMHREDRNTLRASMMYKKALKSNPESMGILLRLALGFMKCGHDMDLAKRCLDVVEKSNPDNTMFLHYKAIYFEMLEEYKEAAAYYKAAAKNNNFPAQILYAVCAKRAGEELDCVQFLTGLLRKFVDKERVMQIWLHLGLQHYHGKAFVEACRCFIKAVEIDRKSEYLKKFKNSLVDGKFVSVLDIINVDLLDKCEDEDVALRLEELCG